MIVWEALTPAQRKLMLKMKEKEAVQPYGGEWPTFYRLKGMGLARYVGGLGVYTTLTDEGRDLMERSGA